MGDVVISDDDGYVSTAVTCCMAEVNILFWFVTPTLAVSLLNFAHISLTIMSVKTDAFKCLTQDMFLVERVAFKKTCYSD